MAASPTALSLLMSMIEKAKSEGRLPSDFQTPTKFENYDDKSKAGSANPMGAAAGPAIASQTGIPIPGLVAGAATGYQQGQGFKALAEGKNPSTIQHAALQPITGGLEYVASPLQKLAGLSHKSTKQYEAERTAELLGMSDNPEWQKTISQLRATEHPEGDKGENFNEADVLEKAKQDGKVLWGVSPIMKQFGEGWFGSLDEAGREGATREMAQAGLLNSAHGDWQITDPNAAQAIFDKYAASKAQPSAQTQVSTRQKAPAKQNRGGRMPPQIPLAPEAPIMPMGPETQPLPTTVEEFSQAFQAALGKVRGLSDVPNPLLRSNL